MSLVKLRPLAPSDVDHIMTWVNDPDIVGNIAAFSGEPFTRDQELAYIESILASRADRVFSIVRAADGAYLGQAGVHQIHWRSRVGRLSCLIASRAEMGKGYGTAAVARLLDWAFGDAKLHKTWLMVFRHNTRAQGVYGRLGFQVEGTLREEYFHRDGWHDMVRMSLLDRERAQPG